MRTIRASEISSYIYCQRAWWYQKNGHPSENATEMAAGSALHDQHGKVAMRIGCLRMMAYLMILTALLFLAIYVTVQII